jgi:hypothetical protein
MPACRELQRREWEEREAALIQQQEEEQQRKTAHRNAVKELSGLTQVGGVNPLQRALGTHSWVLRASIRRSCATRHLARVVLNLRWVLLDSSSLRLSAS